MKHTDSKWIRYLTLSLCLLVSSICVLAGRETAIRTYNTSKIEYSRYIADDSKEYLQLKWDGLDMSDKSGEPELPVEYIRFLVPIYTKVTGVKVSCSPVSSETIGTQIYPAQPPVAIGDARSAEFTPPLESAYSHDYPFRAEYISDGFIDGCNHIVTVAVYPVAYNPSTGYIAYTDSVSVTLEYEDCDASELTSKPIIPPHRSAYLNLERLVVNADKVSDRNYVCRSVNKNRTSEYYYIITPRKLKDAFEDLVVWKRQKGYNVVLKCIEDIYEDSRYQIGSQHTVSDTIPPEEILDTAMSLRCYLKDEFASNGRFFCLLAGDWRTSMPMRKFYHYYSDSIKTEFGQMYVPSDRYFSDLTSPFKLKKLNNSITNIADMSNSISHEIDLGRILCATNQEVRNYIHKLIIYEANPGYGDNDYLSNAFLFEGCNYEWVDGIFKHSGCLITNMQSRLKNIRDEIEQTFKFTLLQDNSHLASSDTASLDPLSINLDSNQGYPPTGPQLISLMQENGLTMWYSHGSPHGFLSSAYSKFVVNSTEEGVGKFPYHSPRTTPLAGSGLDNMNNYNKPMFVFASSCSQAPFDVIEQLWDGEVKKYSLPNVGHALLTKGKNGAVGAILSSRDGYTDGGKMYLNFFSCISENSIASDAFNKSYTNGSYNSFAFNFHGDPEFRIWLGKPEKFAYELLSTPESIIVNGLQSGTTYTMYDAGEVLLENSVLDSTSSITIPNSHDGEYCISFWKQDLLPIITLIARQGNLTESKRYIVRDALIGNTTPSQSTYTISSGGYLSVRAIDNFSVNSGFIVESGGEAVFECDKTVELSGGVVRKGGKLTIKSNQVKIGNGFKVEAGGELKIIKTNINQ